METEKRLLYVTRSVIVYQESGLADPITQLTDLLAPRATFTKLVTAAGSWSLTRKDVGRPFFCAVLEGSFCLSVPDIEPVTAEPGDFIIIPLAHQFETFSVDRKPGDHRQSIPVDLGDGVFRLGRQQGSADMRKLIGYGEFASDHADLIAGLLPPLVHIRGDERLTTLVGLIDDEARTDRSARRGVMTRLLDVLMIEALRSVQAAALTPGLLRGLNDERIGPALRAVHARPDRPWTVPTLAEEAGLSRSAFFDRFTKVVGRAPMDYLLRWRMHLAKQLLPDMPTLQVAEAVGYGSTSAFSSAFSRFVGLAPSTWLRERGRAEQPEDELQV